MQSLIIPRCFTCDIQSQTRPCRIPRPLPFVLLVFTSRSVLQSSQLPHALFKILPRKNRSMAAPRPHPRLTLHAHASLGRRLRLPHRIRLGTTSKTPNPLSKNDRLHDRKPQPPPRPPNPPLLAPSHIHLLSHIRHIHNPRPHPYRPPDP